MPAGGFPTFEDKWLAAEPGFALVRLFLPAPRRLTLTAFAFLAFEFEHAALQIADAAVALAKLGWWAEEMRLAGQGHARHPLTETLFSDPAAQSLPASLWIDALSGASSLRNASAASDLDQLRRQARGFCAPLVTIEAALAGQAGSSVESAVDLCSAGLLLREALRFPVAASAGRTPIPLDLLARHQLTRAELAKAGPRCLPALRDYLRQLDGLLVSALAADPGLPFLRRAWARLDRLGIAKVLAQPGAAALPTTGRRPAAFRQLLAIWLEARRVD